nr:hypothetical protein [Alkalicoccobacillus plakortidis]
MIQLASCNHSVAKEQAFLYRLTTNFSFSHSFVSPLSCKDSLTLLSKVKKSFLPILLAIAMVSMGFSQNAAVAQTNDEMEVLTGSAAQEFVDVTLNAVQEGEIENIADASTYDLEGSVVYTVGGGVTVVTLPVQGEYAIISNVTVFIDEHNNVLQTNEMLVSQNDEGNFKVETYLDGSLLKSVDTDLAYMDDEELLSENTVDPSEVEVMGVGAVAACIGAVLGVGSAASYLIAVGCGGSCVAPTAVTAPICAACIGGFAVVGGAGVTAVVNCFNFL